MKKSFLLLLPVLLFAAAACQNLEPASPEQEVNLRTIEFSSSVGAYTKATDTSFEAGDVVGLTIGQPVNASNVKLTYANGSFTPERTLYWGLDQKNEEKSSFVAYAPYDAATDPSKAFSFTIKADQSAAGAYAASDLLAAKADAGPGEKTVHLAFSHVLSRLVLTLTNTVEGDEIAGVTLGGVQIALTADIPNGRYAATGETAVVTPAKKDNNYVFLVAPQTVAPEVLIAMKSGKIVRYTPDAALQFASGKQVSAAISVQQDAVSFEAEVLDWTDATAFFGKTADSGEPLEEWGILGNVIGSEWVEILPMTLQEDGSYHARISSWAQDYSYINFYIQNLFKNDVRVGPAQPVNYTLVDGEPTEIPISYGYNMFYFPVKEILDVYFSPAKGLVKVVPAPHEWKSMGSGQFIDGFITDLFELPHEEMTVAIEADGLREGMYRIPNPYKEWNWTPFFNYTEGGELVIDASNPDRVYFKTTFTGIADDRYGNFYACSLVPENGWNNYYYYGWYYNSYKYLTFGDYAGIILDQYGTYRTNDEGMMSVTLPEGTRPSIYTGITISMQGTETGTDGVHYMLYNVKPQMDVRTLRYGIWNGTLAREDVLANCLPQVQNNEEGTVVISDFEPDDDNLVKIPFDKSGSYTVLFYAADASGDYWNWLFEHVGVLIDGDTPPAAEISITVPENQGAYADSEITFHIDMPSPGSLAYVVLPSYEFWNSGLTEDSIYDYVMSNGTYANLYYFNDTRGADYVVSGLSPETEYVILAAGENQFEISTWAMAFAVTAKSPEFSYLGTGRYNDFTWMFEGEFRNPVDVFVAKSTQPVRYRVMYPYRNYWSARYDKPEIMENYTWNDAEFFDFYLDGENFVYTSFYNGYQAYYSNSDPRPIILQHYAQDNNRVIAEGVYNLSPWAALEGTNMGYNFRNLWESIFLEMPGVEYTPEWMGSNGAPKRSLKSQGRPSPLVPDGPERLTLQKVKPFTHHLVKTGKPVVIPAQKATPALGSTEEKLAK